MNKAKAKKIKIHVIHPHGKPLKKSFHGPATVQDILGDRAFKGIIHPKSKVLVLHEPPLDMPLPDNAALVVVPEEAHGLALFVKRVKNFFSVEPYPEQNPPDRKP